MALRWPSAGESSVTWSGTAVEKSSVRSWWTVTIPLAPCTSIMYRPGAAPAVLLIVSVELPEGVTGFGLNVTTEPGGAPLRLNVTGQVLEPALIVTLYTASAGAHSVCVPAGSHCMVKSAGMHTPCGCESALSRL